ncbi:MAG TPA: hypothetical protein VFQ35_15640 [Polyangiaceae bacterium]|nr:hypothetical protein [Polyangiaceae bacterium]
MSNLRISRCPRARKFSRGAAFVEALVASVALAGLVTAGFLLFRKWERAASYLDERARTFAAAFGGCGRRRDLSSEASLAWHAFDPRAFVGAEPSKRAFSVSSNADYPGERRESVACNERAVLFPAELTRLRHDIERQLLGRSK